MAKQVIKQACGHECEHILFGNRAERNSRIDWLAASICPDCRRNDETIKARAVSEAAGWPALTGTDKQVAWALKIRATALADEETKSLLEACDGNQSATDAILYALISKTSSRWWIDHQGMDVTLLADEVELTGDNNV